MKIGIKLFAASFFLGLIGATFKIMQYTTMAEILLWATMLLWMVSMVMILKSLYYTNFK